ncbi:hypothetical protein CCACVL1_25425 [Corchorus capsularis]|uniref:Uncharacterized protein n=1 Tax=Corchorus capsularis TaxID=210143 RepID=A0A1R3GKL4_COCAP|nr:hypothetical protein CCACVL1_25425 [Corchorus capsularis]
MAMAMACIDFSGIIPFPEGKILIAPTRKSQQSQICTIEKMNRTTKEE